MTSSTATPYKQLRRPTDDRMIAGVCSGLGRYFGIDPTLVRLGLAVLAVVTWGCAIVAYVAAWALIPEAEAAPVPPDPAWRDPADPSWGQPPAA